MLLKGDVIIRAPGVNKIETVAVLKKYRGPVSKTGSTTGGA